MKTIKTKHTPGPWKVFDSKYSINPGINAHPDLTIITFGCKNEIYGIMGRTHKEANANAQLIAAAPELLEALEGLMYIGERMEEESGETDPFIEKCRKIIAKAQGE